MHQGFWFTFLLFLVSQISAIGVQAQNLPERVVILFDRSSSMNAMLDGVPKIEMGRALFRQMAAESAENQHVAVRFFAGGESESDASNCQASSMALSFGTRAAGAYEGLYGALTARGKKTPLAFATALAKEDLSGWRGERRIVIISDGMDTCGEDPVPLVEQLAGEGIKLDVIGLGEGGELGQLAEMGLMGGGEFQMAGSYGDFAGAMGNMLPGLGDLPPMPPAAGGSPAGAGAAAGAGGSMAGSAGQAGPAGSSAAGAGQGAGKAPVAPLPPDQPIVVELRLKPEEEKPQHVAVEVILDASGSMAGRIEGQTKMSLAMTALEKALPALESDIIHMGLRAYGFDRSVEKTPEASCPNTALLTDFAPNQAGKVLETAKALAPYGYTPIAASLKAAAQDLSVHTNKKRQLVLITDGEETCGGDPIAVLKDVAGMCVDVNAHIIGFDLDPAARAEMQAIAAAGCGEYLDAPTGGELEKALVKITELVEAKTRIDWDRYANPVTGGATVEQAVELTEGAYTFEKHLVKGEKQFFFIPTKNAQRLRFVVTAQGRLVRFDDSGELVERPGYDFTNFWAEFQRFDGKKIPGPNTRLTFRSAKPGYQEEAQYLTVDDEGVYMMVHANSMLINKDTRFDLLIDEAGDRFVQTDAPPQSDGAERISLGETVTGHIGLSDRADVYALPPLAPGQSFEISFNPTNPSLRYKLMVRRSDTRRAISRNNGLEGPHKVTVTMPDDSPPLYLEVNSQVPANRIFSSYVFVVEQKP